MRYGRDLGEWKRGKERGGRGRYCLSTTVSDKVISAWSRLVLMTAIYTSICNTPFHRVASASVKVTMNALSMEF